MISLRIRPGHKKTKMSVLGEVSAFEDVCFREVPLYTITWLYHSHKKKTLKILIRACLLDVVGQPNIAQFSPGITKI